MSLYDPNSCANFNAFLTTHLHLNLKIDFNLSILKGFVRLNLIRQAAKSESDEQPVSQEQFIILDASSLHVKEVKCDELIIPFIYTAKATQFGDSLKIDVSSIISDWPINTMKSFQIAYETTDKCTAAQWLTPEQTVGKVHPYLFTQCQAIHARSLLPCQDSPSVKATYSADMTVCKYLTVVMSANKSSGPVEHFDSPDWIFSFEQTTPIPSYLIAIGAGNLDHKTIGPRSTIWCEPEVLEAAAWEFTDAETFIRTGEELTTPYVWGRYDILLLPPSFPYGGMENPCLTFLTPSLLAGDHSLVDVLAHEIAHSWTGNLVTAANWEHFWLNEGFTMFLERKILGRLHGECVRQFSSICGLTDLREAVDQFGPEHAATKLRPDLSATDPDDVFSSIPYEKGHTFLAYLEELVGGPSVFEPFFKAHILEFAGKSITTDDFINFFKSYFAAKNIEVQVDWEVWLNAPGLPPSFPNYDRSLMHPCEQLMSSLLKCTEEAHEEDGIGTQTSASMTACFTSLNLDQKLVFLDLLATNSSALNSFHLHTLEVDFGLSLERNVEICLRWFLLALRAGYTSVVSSALTFITQHGRMKYNRPIYRALHRLGGEFRDAARETFTANRKFYHPIAANMIEKDLQC